MTTATATPCRECTDAWSHCHSTWIDHAGVAGECTDDGCRIEVEGHEHVVRCEEVGCTC